MTFEALWGEQLTAELGTSDGQVSEGQRFTTTRRKAAINEAQTEFIERTECLVKLFDVAVVDSTEEYDLETVTNYLRIASRGPSLKMVDASANVRYVEGPTDFPQKNPPVLNRQMPGWRAHPDGTPAGWYLRRDASNLYFGLTPPPDIPSGETWTLQIPCVVRAEDMSATTDVPFKASGAVAGPSSMIPWHKALVHQAAYLLEKLRKDPQRMKLQAELFESYVQRYRRQDRPKGGQTIQMAKNYRRIGSPMRRFSVNADNVT